MCGIAGFHIKPEAKGRIQAGYLMDWLLKGIEHRGREATGFLSVGFDHELMMDKAACPAMQFIQKRKSIPSAPQTVLGHTRLATQGTVHADENNHPVQYGTVFVTHNGWILNDDEVFKQNDLERTAEVDSVAIAASIWNNTEGEFTEYGIESALEDLSGAMAIAAVDVKQPGTLLLARGNSSPLVMIETKDIIIWASEAKAIQEAWGKVFGTPPSAKRFTIFQEGDYRLYENGELKLQGQFQPAWASKYNFGFSSLDEDYWSHRASETSMTIGTPRTLEFGKNGYTEGGDGSGTWITMPDGSRTFMPVGEPSTLDSIPPKADIEVARGMSVWAKIDAQAHEDTIYDFSQELELSMHLVAWIFLYADDDTLKANPSLVRIKRYVEQRYAWMYDENLNRLLEEDADNPPTPALEGEVVDENKCPLCKYNSTGGQMCAGCQTAVDRGLMKAEKDHLCIRCDEPTGDLMEFYCQNCITEMASEYEPAEAIAAANAVVEIERRETH